MVLLTCEIPGWLQVEEVSCGDLGLLGLSQSLTFSAISMAELNTRLGTPGTGKPGQMEWDGVE
jgi:hypothetical protein